ncbi:BTAD domain-containing putative transcriptional regulator [Streptomyces sp. NPDC005438]|uniref:BTAD domain-containing putative transcriptional regulator n=1 Tax=Streptomyces sp. NPDC005438 TaxID=3156880 RepID=UPI0033A0E2B8
MRVRIEVLGAVRAVDPEGRPLGLRGPRHREVLARLLVARGRLVPTEVLLDDLWAGAPPAGALTSLRTFVAALRRSLEPERPPRTPPRLLVTEGPGYALRPDRLDVDAHHFEQALEYARSATDPEAEPRLREALALWRGPAYADLPESPWIHAERARLEELRLQAVERHTLARLHQGVTAPLIPLLERHLAEHPWREPAWGLLARTLYLDGRQGEALTVLDRVRTRLRRQLGVDPGPALRQLELDILRRSPTLEVTAPRGGTWESAVAAYQHAPGVGPRTRLRSTVDLVRTLAIGGGDGLVAARRQRLEAIRSAEATGDSRLTARVIGAYDVPAIWSRLDDPAQAHEVVAAAERALTTLTAEEHHGDQLPHGTEALRARLLSTIAVESRGSHSPRAVRAAYEAERLARRLGDPHLLVFALNGVFLQSFTIPGHWPRRDALGTELVDLSARHGLTAHEILGHLVRLQARSALGDLPAAEEHARAAESLADAHESPAVTVLTTWFRAMRHASEGTPVSTVESAYRAASVPLATAGMPGVADGLLPLALLGLHLLHDRPAPTDPTLDWGPYTPWARPLLLLAQGRSRQAADAVRQAPPPTPDHLHEALWCALRVAALRTGVDEVAAAAHEALRPAAREHAGAGSGLLTFGPVARYLAP